MPRLRKGAIEKATGDWPDQCDQTLHFQNFRDRVGDDATFQTEAEVARPRINYSRPWWERRDFRVQKGEGVVLLTKGETARLSRPRRRWRDFPTQGGDGANKIQFLANKVETARISRIRRRWRDFSKQGGHCAIFATVMVGARFLQSE